MKTESALSPKILCMCGKDIGYLIAEFLLEQKANVRFIVNPDEKPGEWYRTPRELNIEELTESEIAQFKPDLIFTAFYNRILPVSIYSIPPLGCWNLHLADSELYRGAHPNIHAIRNGDTEFGVTIHLIDSGIDTGSILAKSVFPLSSSATGRDLYELMVIEGVKLFIRCFPDLAGGKALKLTRAQDNSRAVTHFRHELSHRVYPSESFSNSVRALAFPPFPPPYFMIGNRRFKITEDTGDDR